MQNNIEIKNARIHNLRGVNVTIPKNKLTVITGVSGSGKSSLAFDTLYEEGKKRYLIFSGTQFMIEKEEIFDSITGLSPTVAVEQRIIRQSNPRSTVGTRIKLDTMLAALMANYGVREEAYDDHIPLQVGMFQRNSPKGMCIKCLGAGTVFSIDEEAIFTDPKVTIENLFNGNQTHYRHLYMRFEILYGISHKRTIESLSEEELQLFKYGDGGGNSGFSGYLGVIPWLMENYKYHTSKGRKNWVTQLDYMGKRTCPLCGGCGLGQQAIHTTFAGKNITELENMYISDLYVFLKAQKDKKNRLLDEILVKLSGLLEVGLGHLMLSRLVPTLSGGELQRLFLAAYIMAGMDSIIFVFDEPTIGLHEIEKENLIKILRRLVASGNTVVAVEHDERFIREADYLIDMGPGAGVLGGHKLYEGSFQGFSKSLESRIAPYLFGEKGFPIKETYRTNKSGHMLKLSRANLHNLRDVTIELPLGVMIGIAGVSGSGKSSLISDTLVPILKEQLKSKCITGLEDKINEDREEEELTKAEGSLEEKALLAETQLSGAEHLKGCYVIDQRPIARSRTSCPATYTGIFDRIRTLFAETSKAKERGYSAGMFSRNSEGGCPKCKGDGIVHHYVGYGSFIDIVCEDCEGTGYLPEVMEIHLDGKNIGDVLKMSVDEAEVFFKGKDEGICNILSILQKVGMGYITLGQATPSISGGESQRIKLAKELSKGKKETLKSGRGSLYILDEPTTGLSMYDAQKLLVLLNGLVDCGHSVIITEHDPHILANCDYLIEMGKGGGKEGGEVIATGTPQELRHNTESVIGRYL